VRINITYTGICQSDLGVNNEEFGKMLFPSIAGHEIIGIIAKVGSSVTNFKEGEVVGVGPYRECCETCDYCESKDDNCCIGPIAKLTAFPYFGGFATSIQLSYTTVVKIPDGIELESAPALMCAGGTVFAPIKRYGKEGKKCAILGVGGLGHLAVQYSKKMGMKTYAVTTTDSKKDSIKELGADVVVNSTDPEQLKAFMGEKIDLILNTTSQGDVTCYVRALRKATGVYVQIGAPDFTNKNPLNLIELLLNQWTVTGSAAASREVMKEMLHFTKIKNVKPIVEMFKFEDFPKAYERISKGKPIYRVVVDVKSFEFQGKK